MQSVLDSFIAGLSVWLPRIIAVLLILLIGWIVAKIAAALTRRLLGWVKLDERLAKGLEGAGEKPTSVENLIVQFVYHLILYRAGVCGCGDYAADECRFRQARCPA